MSSQRSSLESSQSQVLLAYSLAAREEPPGDPAGFRRLVGPEGPLAGITATCFLLSSRDFLERVVPRLLTQLNRSTHPRRVVLRGRARGQVDWGATVKARSGGSQDPTIFVCRQSWRLYDLPENRLLNYLLERLRRCKEAVPADLKPWTWSITGDPLGGGRRGIDEELEWLAHRLRRFRKNAYLRDIQLPQAVDGEHLQAARGSRNPFYNEAAAFHERYEGAVENPRWTAWRRMVRRNATLLPAGEAEALADFTAAAGSGSGPPRKAELPGRSQRVVVGFVASQNDDL